jgi:2',3'-cyclic-nucleotide 2'-phosphodiesterase (5'-nucleotidase family)
MRRLRWRTWTWSKIGRWRSHSPELDLIVGGHDHVPLTSWSATAPAIVKAGSDWSHLGHVVLRLRRTGRPTTVALDVVPNSLGSCSHDR